MIKRELYMETMNVIQVCLEESLDPESRSALLCVLAKCYLAQVSLSIVCFT